MRYLIFTDIHGNLEALDALLDFLKKEPVDRYVHLGDMVGYGASPNEVIQKIKALKPLSIIRGNHDKAVCGLDTIESFNPIAASAIHWTQQKLTHQNLDFLCALKQGPLTINDRYTICHGAPFDEDFYIFGEFDAAEAFDYIQTPICFFGHTHFPYIYTKKDTLVEGILLEGDSNEIKIEEDISYLINPGSVGQPRDRNPKAACAIFDTEAGAIHFFRIDYDIEAAQTRIIKENLPTALAERLSLGI